MSAKKDNTGSQIQRLAIVEAKAKHSLVLAKERIWKEISKKVRTRRRAEEERNLQDSKNRLVGAEPRHIDEAYLLDDEINCLDEDIHLLHEEYVAADRSIMFLARLKSAARIFDRFPISPYSRSKLLAFKNHVLDDPERTNLLRRLSMTAIQLYSVLYYEAQAEIEQFPWNEVNMINLDIFGVQLQCNQAIDTYLSSRKSHLRFATLYESLKRRPRGATGIDRIQDFQPEVEQVEETSTAASGLEPSVLPSSPFQVSKRDSVSEPPSKTLLMSYPAGISCPDGVETTPSYPQLNAGQSFEIMQETVPWQHGTGAQLGRGTGAECDSAILFESLAPPSENRPIQTHQYPLENPPFNGGSGLIRSESQERARPISQCRGTAVSSNPQPPKKRKHVAEEETEHSPNTSPDTPHAISSIPFLDSWQTTTMKGSTNSARVPSSGHCQTTFSIQGESLEASSQAVQVDSLTIPAQAGLYGQSSQWRPEDGARVRIRAMDAAFKIDQPCNPGNISVQFPVTDHGKLRIDQPFLVATSNGLSSVHASETPTRPSLPDVNDPIRLQPESTISEQSFNVSCLPTSDMRFGTSMSNPTGIRQTEQKDPFRCTDEQAAKCVTYDGANPNIQQHMALLTDSDHVQTTGVEGQLPKMTISVDMTTSAMAKGVSDDVNSTDCLEVTQTTTAGLEGGAKKPGFSSPQAPSFGVLRIQSCDYCRKRKLMCNATVCSWEVRNTPQIRNRRRCDSCRRSKQRCDVTETTGCTQCILRSLRCTMTDSQKPTKPDYIVEAADKEGSTGHVRCPGNIHNLGQDSRKFSVEALGVPVEGLPAQLLPPKPNAHYPQPTPEPRLTATTGSESSDHPRMGALRSEEESACTPVELAETQRIKQKRIISQWPTTHHDRSCPHEGRGDKPPRYAEYKPTDVLQYLGCCVGHLNLCRDSGDQHKRRYKSQPILGIEIALLLDQCDCREDCLGTSDTLHVIDARLSLGRFREMEECKVVVEFRRVLCTSVRTRVYGLGYLHVRFRCTKALFMFMGAVDLKT